MGRHGANSPEALLEQGIALVRQGSALRALPLIEQSYRLKQTPHTRSYLGMLLSVERGQFNAGITLCKVSLDESPDDPVMYLNLAEALYAADRKKEAFETAWQGLDKGENAELATWLADKGIRKKPPLPFLGRRNPINRYLGMLLAKMGIRK